MMNYLRANQHVMFLVFSMVFLLSKSPRCFPAPPFSLHPTPGGPNLRWLNRSEGIEMLRVEADLHHQVWKVFGEKGPAL